MHHNSSDSSEKAPVESVVIDLLINEFALLCNIFLLLLFESWFDITDRNLLFILVLRCLAVDGSLSVVWYYFGERNWQSEHACLRAQRRCWLLRWALLSVKSEKEGGGDQNIYYVQCGSQGFVQY